MLLSTYNPRSNEFNVADLIQIARMMQLKQGLQQIQCK